MNFKRNGAELQMILSHTITNQEPSMALFVQQKKQHIGFGKNTIIFIQSRIRHGFYVTLLTVLNMIMEE